MQNTTSNFSSLARQHNPFNQNVGKMNEESSDNSNEASAFSVSSQIQSKDGVLTEKEKGKFCGPNGPICRYFKKTKFGTWDGVYLSCLLSMFGVIMFLRLGYIVGQAGIWVTWLINVISTLVVLITTLSMSALCSNGEIKQGGAYYLISRSLGPEVGGSIGILFTLGNSIAVAMHTLGFVEPMIAQIGKYMTDNLKNDMRVYGTFLLLFLLFMAFIGVGWMIKVQFLIAFILLVAISCFVIGCFVTKDADFLAGGFQKSVFEDNFNSAFSDGISFMTVFGIFFPAMTGIMAGANLSGDLEKPEDNIPLGTTTAVLTAGLMYMFLTTMIGFVASRGDPNICAMDNPTKGICYKLIMEKIAVPGEMVYAGIYAASLSSALAAFVGGPRIFTTVAEDRILRILDIFAKKRMNGEPLYAYIPVTIIALSCVAIADIDVIAEIVTVIYLMTYCLINFACFQSSISKSPGWRPRFRMYNCWVALFGALGCFGLIFALNYLVAIIVTLFTVGVYLLIYFMKPKVNWGSATHGVANVSITMQMQSQRKRVEHIKNFRPNVILLSENPGKDLKLIKFLATLRKVYGANFLGVITKSWSPSNEEKDFYELNNPKIVLFRKTLVYDNYYEGCKILLQLVGTGKIKPNTMFIKYPSKWHKSKERKEGFFSLVCEAVKRKMGIMVAVNFKSIAFSNPDPFGTIDIWWLYEDGGLSVLIPYILSKNQFWRRNTEGGSRKAPLRLFVVARNLENERKSMDVLLNNFRLVKIKVISVFPEEDGEDSDPWKALGNLMQKHSKAAKIVFCTMPLPHKKQQADEYLHNLDTISEDMPSIVLIRGNGERVLTSSQE